MKEQPKKPDAPALPELLGNYYTHILPWLIAQQTTNKARTKAIKS